MSDGKGCECYARSAGECCCDDVDWTPSEVVELRELAKQLYEALKEIGDAYTPTMYSLGWEHLQEAIAAYEERNGK